MIIAWVRANVMPTLVVSALAILLALFGWQHWQKARGARTETNLVKGQADASMKSGKDAVDTIGNRMAADAAGDQLTRENDDAIRSAEGALAPVAPALRDAGLASLCRRPAYNRDPQCVQQPDPR